MEFKSLGNIETSFRQIRLYAFVFAIVCVAVSGYAVYASYSFAKEQREKIYVLDQGKSLMLALSQDASRNRPVEAREHVRRFHELFFTIAPDKDAIEKNMERAFVLCDKSAFNYYKDLAEKGYYNRAISGNVNQRIEVDITRYGTVIIALLCQVFVIVESRLVTQHEGTFHILLNGILVGCNGKEQFMETTYVFSCLHGTVSACILTEGKHERLTLIKHIDFLPLLLSEAVRGIDGIIAYRHADDGKDKGIESYLPE